MATYRVTDPESGRTVNLVGDSPPTEKELEQIFTSLPEKPLSAESAMMGVLEPAATIASGMIAEPLAGIAGIAQSINPWADDGAGAKAVKATKEALTYQPKTAGGKENLQSIGGVVQKGVDVANMAAGGVAGLGKLATGQGINEAVKSIKSVQEQGLSKSLGEAGLEATGSPLVATILETTPTAILSALGVRTKAGQAPDITSQRAKEIQDVLAYGAKHNIDVMTSDLFAPKSIMSRLNQQFQERIPYIGTGGNRAKQYQQRVDALEKLDEATPRVESADIITSLSESANKTKVAAGKRMTANQAEMDILGNVSTENTIKRIDRAIEILAKPGKMDNKPLMGELESLKKTVEFAGEDFSMLRDFRTDARTIADKVDPAGRSQLRGKNKALMDAIVGGVTKDLDNFVLSNAGEKAFARYKHADKIYGQEAGKLTKSRLKAVLDKGDVKPELVNNLLFSSTPSEVKLLFKNLDQSGRQNARMALLRRALDNSISKGDMSTAKFTTELEKLGQGFQVFFRGDARAELEGLKKLLDTTKRTEAAGVVTSSGQALQVPATAGVIGAGLMGEPTAIATMVLSTMAGAGAKIYESAGVRNALVKLGKAKKRSTLEADLKKSIPLLLERSSQALEQEQQEEQQP